MPFARPIGIFHLPPSPGQGVSALIYYAPSTLTSLNATGSKACTARLSPSSDTNPCLEYRSYSLQNPGPILVPML